MRYRIYKVEPKTLKQTPLGTVNAKHVPHAVLLAMRRWPDQCDWSQGQAGFRAIKVRKTENGIR